MLTPFLQHALRENRVLFGMMHSFNFHPALHIHPTRFKQLPRPAYDLLCGSRRGEKKLSAWAVRQWNLPTDKTWDFADPRRRLVLLPPNQLGDLILYAGAAICSKSISKTIDRATKTQFKNLLGERAFHFAVKRASLINRGMQEIASITEKEQAPEVQLHHAGVNCLVACLEDCPEELHHRLNLKCETDMPFETSRFNSETQDHAWSMIKRILFTETAPELKSCFN